MEPYRTGKIANNFYAVQSKNANYFVYINGTAAVCFDAGYKEREGKGEFKRLPIGPETVTHLFLTHSDVDHAGGADLFKNAEIYLSPDEEPLIDGTTPRSFGRLYWNQPIERYTPVTDGDVFIIGNTHITAIATPGHTPGSMCYLINDEILVCGDTLILKDGRVRVLWPVYNMDTERERTSIRKLAALENIGLMVTAHSGGTTDYAYAMREWKK
jgi:glyoxylase-like metal-dependent hydrolase (beta-lactamase superfamily II)